MNISVIIPTYNRRHTLSRAIDSVLGQAYQAAEIIVVDDGSSDGTSEWLRENFPTLQLLQHSNKGVSAARNRGIKAAKTNWIALLDSDDEWLPDKLEKQVEALKQNPEMIFCHTEEIWIRNGVRVNQMKKHKKYGGFIFENCLDICRISPSSALFHKSLLADVGNFDEDLKLCEDYDLWLRITAKFPVLFLKNPLIKKYGGHPDQLSNVKDGIESYRIQVLEKLIQINFTLEQKKAIRRILVKKLGIFSIGAQKRGRKEKYNNAVKRIDELSSMV